LPRRTVGKVAAPQTTTTTLLPGETAPPTTVAPTTVPDTVPPVGGPPVVSVVDAGTTILPSNTNPFSPVPSVDPNRTLVFDCEKPLPAWAQTTIAGG
jgi:hypothetical protein